MKIKTWRDPYDAGFSPTRSKEIELKPGLTVLVGCNGAGKTTLLLNLEEVCKKNNIPYILYDNLSDGGSNAMGMLFSSGDYNGAAYLFSASEGECIKNNLGRKAGTFNEFIENGFVNDRQYRLMKAFSSDKKDDEIESMDRVMLFDAVDSGLSVDSVVEVKDLFNQILNDYKDSDKNLYIIIAANEYELARNADCFDVNTGKYIRFKNYEEYRAFIIKSRERKEKRYIQQAKWREKQKQKELKEYAKVIEKQKRRLKELENREYVSSWEKDDIERMPDDFIRHARFITEEDVRQVQGRSGGIRK